jgi:hypothetical protein
LLGVRIIAQFYNPIATVQPCKTIRQLAKEEILQGGIRRVAAPQPQHAWRRAETLNHLWEICILRHDVGTRGSRCCKDWRIISVTQPKVASRDALNRESGRNPPSD